MNTLNVSNWSEMIKECKIHFLIPHFYDKQAFCELVGESVSESQFHLFQNWLCDSTIDDEISFLVEKEWKRFRKINRNGTAGWLNIKLTQPSFRKLEDLPCHVQEEIRNNLTAHLEDYNHGFFDCTEEYVLSCVSDYIKRVAAMLGITITNICNVCFGYKQVYFEGIYQYHAGFSLQELLKETKDKTILDIASALLCLYNDKPFTVNIRLFHIGYGPVKDFIVRCDTSGDGKKLSFNEIEKINITVDAVVNNFSDWAFTIWQAAHIEIMRMKEAAAKSKK